MHAPVRPHWILLFFITSSLFLGACASSTSGEENDDAETPASSANLDDLGTAFSMDFVFAIAIDSLDDAYDVATDFADTYEITLYIQADGTASLVANEFPTIIYRICELTTTRTDCDAYTDATDQDVDLVIDACSYADDALCGDTDETVISGTLASSGRFFMSDVPMRSRIFAVTSSTTGRSIDETDSGLIDVDPLTTDLTTGTVTINGGDGLSATGSPLSNREITIVGGGIIPASYPVLANSYFMGTIVGTFDQDPLTILE